MKIFELNVYNVEEVAVIEGIPNGIVFTLKDGHFHYENEGVASWIAKAIYDGLKQRLSSFAKPNDNGTLVFNDNYFIRMDVNDKYSRNLVIYRKTLESGIESTSSSDVQPFINKYYAKVDINK